jgi:hypothetical protein
MRGTHREAGLDIRPGSCNTVCVEDVPMMYTTHNFNARALPRLALGTVLNTR